MKIYYVEKVHKKNQITIAILVKMMYSKVTKTIK